MEWRKAQKRVFETLEEISHQRGLRTVHELEDHLGVYRGFLRKARSKTRIDLSQLISFLKLLEIDPASFMRLAFWDSWPEIDAVKIFGHFSAATLRRSSEGEELLKTNWGEGQQEADINGSEEKLREVDLLSFSSPKKAATSALNLYREALVRKDLFLAVRAAAARSSGLRFNSEIEGAQALLWRSIVTVQDLLQPRWRCLYADLLRRATYIACDSDKPFLGMKLAECAIETSVLTGDFRGIGRGLAVHGTATSLCDLAGKAVPSLRSAIFWLGKGDEDYLLTCHFNLALELMKIEQYDQAGETLNEAEKLADRVRQAHFKGRVEWLRARISQETSTFQESELYYMQAYDKLREFPADSTLLCAEVLGLLVQEGGVVRKNAWLQRFLQASFAVTKCPAVDRAISQLVRNAEAGGLSDELLKEVREELKRRQGVLTF